MSTYFHNLQEAFKLYAFSFLFLIFKKAESISTEIPLELRKQLFNLRELVLLQKNCTTNEGADVLREAISVFAGHGVMEEFSSLPRIFRDVVVNEQWEGPRNLLLTQIFRDIQRVSDWYSPAEFVASILDGTSEEKKYKFSLQLEDLLQRPVLGEVNDVSIDAAIEWDDFCSSIFKVYQEIALKEIE
ncbi:hypothetical protein LIS82_15565 [Cytobacillus solani]|uniref:Acyl-CoA dehydrogenase/oxidase C-terminal domain-containing protein n=1 Tax=Cytobacillus solani TaxID=1637975 RepID=A0A0Q3VIC5_9BACI|nr:hypothetical protein AMS60_10030 [Bacillus sp. FJAT-21945]KQL19802.1 hypothetical protein AN957_15340 [Cytobacillus solani]USK53036.1 hypothetical protein LIS82_15565 [Cytobacillus solani]